MKIIGITGPTGAGKTTALNALTSLGACIIDADAVQAGERPEGGGLLPGKLRLCAGKHGGRHARDLRGTGPGPLY